MFSTKLKVGFSVLLFIVFFSNVVIGAISGITFLNDSGEALVLLSAVIVFVVAMLASETQANT